MERQESGASATSGQDAKQRMTLADWIGDMVALESHIEEALDRQLKQVKDDDRALNAVRGYHDLVKRQRDAIAALHKEYGGTAGSPIKQVGAALLGKAAGVIDMVRTEGNSKALRDDYTAFNLAAIGYTMLFTTATAFGDQRVASLAQEHLRGYAEAVQEINHLIPDVVVAELAKDEHAVASDTADKTRKMVDKVWKQTARQTTGGTAS